MCDAEPRLFKIEYQFGTLIVDEDIYYRIEKDKSKVPESFRNLKPIRGVSFLNKLVSCRFAGSDKKYTLARLLMRPERNEMVDHINRNPLDNRRSNLRIVSPRQNSINRTPNSSTGFIGVSKTNNRGKMRLRTTFQPAGKRLHFGMNDDKPENRIICALVHDKFVIESGDELYAPMNFAILKAEPFRSKLTAISIDEFRENSLKYLANKLGISKLCEKQI